MGGGISSAAGGECVVAVSVSPSPVCCKGKGRFSLRYRYRCGIGINRRSQLWVAVSVAPPVENVLWRYRYRHRQCAVKGRAASRCGTGIAAVSVSVVGVSCGWRYAAAGGMPALVVVTVSVAPQVVSPPRSHYRRVLTTAAFVPNASAGRGQLLQRLRDLHTAAMSVPRSSPYQRGGEARGGRGINSA